MPGVSLATYYRTNPEAAAAISGATVSDTIARIQKYRFACSPSDNVASPVVSHNELSDLLPGRLQIWRRGFGLNRLQRYWRQRGNLRKRVQVCVETRKAASKGRDDREDLQQHRQPDCRIRRPPEPARSMAILWAVAEVLRATSVAYAPAR